MQENLRCNENVEKDRFCASGTCEEQGRVDGLELTTLPLVMSGKCGSIKACHKQCADWNFASRRSC